MTAEEAVVAALQGNQAVVNIVGGGDDARIYQAGKAPQGGPLPYLTWQRISAPAEASSGLTLRGAAGPDRIRVQVNAWDASFGGNAHALAQKVRDALHGAHGGGCQVIQCSAPVDFDPDQKLQIDGSRVDAIVILNEAAAAAA